MLNVEKYKNEIIEKWNDSGALEDAVISVYQKDTNKKHDYSTSGIIQWLCGEVQLLTLEEQKYLYCFLHPYLRDYDITIKKEHNDRHGKNEFLIIYFSLKADSHHDIGSIYFSDFMAGTRYQGLETGKEYTLEELGLYKK